MPALKGSGDSTIETPVQDSPAAWLVLIGPTEEVSIWKVFCHHFERKKGLASS